MFSRLQWWMRQLLGRVWVRVTAFSVLGVATALLALLLRRYIPEDIPAQIGSDAVDSLLHIIAMSMLSVTIFSLSTIVSALSAATSNVTPRATRLLAADSLAQNSLATFLGTFLFSLVGIIGLQTGLYGSTGRVVLYVMTLLVIALIVVTLLRWIDHVMQLGRTGTTSERVEVVATEAMVRRRDAPFLGGCPRPDARAVPAGGRALRPERMGYVEHIDVEHLQTVAEKQGLQVHVMVLPGHFASPGQPLAYMVGTAPDDCLASLRDAFTIADSRNFDQDPRFGLVVLSEIACRALSPAVNDAGTAIDLLSRGARVIALWADTGEPGQTGDAPREVACPRVHVPAEQPEDLFEEFFTPISRDGAPIIEVAVHIQQMLHVLWQLGDERYQRAATRCSAQALARGQAALSHAEDRARLRASAAWAQADSVLP